MAILQDLSRCMRQVACSTIESEAILTNACWQMPVHYSPYLCAGRSEVSHSMMPVPDSGPCDIVITAGIKENKVSNTQTGMSHHSFAGGIRQLLTSSI
jgi:hypothetical protein